MQAKAKTQKMLEKLELFDSIALRSEQTVLVL